ncbi:MAG: glycogen synthase [Spirochaetaceae bacterium]
MPNLRVLIVSSEAFPFAKTGGLADAVAGLAEALSRQGNDVRVVLPRYYAIDRNNLHRLPEPLGVPVGPGERWSAVFQTENEARYYFLDHEELFGRDGIYGPQGEESYTDNLSRFAFLCRGSLQLCRYLSWKPDVLHLHDWPGALVSVLLRGTDDYPDLAEVPAVLTVHNARYQGIFSPEDVGETGLSEETARQLGVIADGNVNLLRAGALYADTLTTVSPGYAEEVKRAPFGAGLESLFRFKGVTGILNGADYNLWNPETDRHLPAAYSTSDSSGKRAGKSGVLRRFGLPGDLRRPLVAMISRLTEQKGFDLLTSGSPSLLERIAALPLNLIILGTGNPAYEAHIADLAARRENVVGRFTFDDGLSHLFGAAADFFLMPSKWEPCGLSQIYALRYGTVPIVTKTGGLRDTVDDLSEDYSRGTGIVIPKLEPEGILEALRRALALYQGPPGALEALRKRCMEKRFTWDASAAGYFEVYEEAIRRSRRA